jgi:carbonic anhydrase
MRCVLVAVAVSACAHAPAHWGYEGEHGPNAWGRLDPTYVACESGQHQSPIDLHGAEEASLPPLEARYAAFTPALVDNGHTLQAAAPPGNVVVIDGHPLELAQFHFHRPSEHLIDGKPWPAELHFVHRDEAGKLAVIAVPLSEGPADHAALAALLAGEQVNPADLFPVERTYFQYEGSLTTPPCTEGVTWRVFVSPISASAQQLLQVEKRVPTNSRPVMPLNDRRLRLGR